jgi:hypothetical protein
MIDLEFREMSLIALLAKGQPEEDMDETRVDPTATSIEDVSCDSIPD